MPYRTIYEITSSLPQAAVQVFYELFPCYPNANLSELIGRLMAVLCLSTICCALLSALKLRFFQLVSNRQRVFAMAGMALVISVTTFCVFYHSHSELATLYSDNQSSNVAMVEGTVRHFHGGAVSAKSPYTSSRFILGGQTVEIFSNVQGFNNPLDASIYNGAKIKIWLLKAPGTTRTTVLRLDTAD